MSISSSATAAAFGGDGTVSKQVSSSSACAAYGRTATPSTITTPRDNLNPQNSTPIASPLHSTCSILRGPGMVQEAEAAHNGLSGNHSTDHSSLQAKVGQALAALGVPHTPEALVRPGLPPVDFEIHLEAGSQLEPAAGSPLGAGRQWRGNRRAEIQLAGEPGDRLEAV